MEAAINAVTFSPHAIFCDAHQSNLTSLTGSGPNRDTEKGCFLRTLPGTLGCVDHNQSGRFRVEVGFEADSVASATQYLGSGDIAWGCK
jgi:hypothetical protein